MIFVTVGNATQGFRRLLEAVDEMAGKGLFQGENVFIQSGNTPEFRSSHCKQTEFLSFDQFTKAIRDADLVICHAGAGTLLHVLRSGKVPVVMPRRNQYGEHVDDHQVELVKELTMEGRIIPAYEPNDLPGSVAEARRRNTQACPPPPTRMLELVDRVIRELISTESTNNKRGINIEA